MDRPDPLGDDDGERWQRVPGRPSGHPVLEGLVEAAVEATELVGGRADLVVPVGDEELGPLLVVHDPVEVVLHQAPDPCFGVTRAVQHRQRPVVVLGQALDVEGVGELLLAAEVVVEAADAGAGAVQQLLDGGVDHAVLEEARQGGVEHGLASARCGHPAHRPRRML